MSDSQLKPNGRVYVAPAAIEPGMYSGPYGNAESGLQSLTPRDIFEAIRRRLWVIGLMTILFVGAALAYSLIQTPVYQATTLILVGQKGAPKADAIDVWSLNELTKTMEAGVQNNVVAQSVIEQQNLQLSQKELSENLSAEQVEAGQFLEINYTDPNPRRAQQVADAFAKGYSEYFAKSGAVARFIAPIVWQPAELPDAPVSPDIPLNVALAAIMGLMFGVSLAFVLEYLNDSWRSPEEAERITGVPTFGSIPQFQFARGKKGKG